MAGIVIIKSGSTFPSLVATRGDFEDWVLSGLQAPPRQATVVESSAWGVQFHPEFDAGAVVKYIRHFREALLDEK